MPNDLVSEVKVARGNIARPTGRAIALGLLLTAAIGLLIPYADLKLQGTWISCCHLPIAVVVPFLLLVAVANPLLRLVAPANCLTPTEIVVIYCMTLCGAGIPSFGLTEYLLPTLAGVRYYASAENRWGDLFIRYIPDWLAPTDEAAVNGFFEGLHPGAHIPWGAWGVPLVAWTLLAAGFFLCFVAISVFMRRQWVEEERLIFPLVQLPIQVLQRSVEGGEGAAWWPLFFRNRWMWIGAAIPLIIHSINGLHFLFPSVPAIPLSHSINQYFTVRPWNQMGLVMVILHFSIVGFSFLLSNELSFSLWFFFILFNLQSVALAAYGVELQAIPDYPTRPHAALQMLGAFLVFAGFIMWLLRRRARIIWAHVRSGEDEQGEPLSPRGILWWGGLGLAITVSWCSAAGITPSLTLLCLTLFWGVAIVLTRCVSEGGLLFIQAPFRPLDIIGLVAGTKFIGAPALTSLAFVQRVFMLDLRTFLLPSLLDSYKLAGWARIELRRLMLPIALALAVAVLSSYVAMIVIPYRYAGVSLSPWFLLVSPQQPFKTLASRLLNPVQPSPTGLLFVAIGILVTAGLFTMRSRFAWWPLHPMGYAMGPSWPMIQLWFSILVGWLAKAVLLRYGSAKTYEGAKPFFMGLVVGEFLAAALWLIVSHCTGAVGLRFFLF
ncbi:MAG: DUF6785 family protein [Candidatus Zipacnadales bacterium]